MPKIWKKNCDNCGNHYESSAKRFCSLKCRNEKRIGFKQSEETKRKIGEGNKGKVVSSASRRRMRIAKKKQFDSGYKVWCDGLTAKTDKRIAVRAMRSVQTRIIKGSHRGKNNPAWKGGISKSQYAWNWRRISRSLKELNNYACEVCRKIATGRKLDVHHKDLNKMNNDIKNLIVLCRSCHREVHPLKGDL